MAEGLTASSRYLRCWWSPRIAEDEPHRSDAAMTMTCPYNGSFTPMMPIQTAGDDIYSRSTSVVE